MSNSALQRKGVLEQIPPCPGEGDLPEIQRKVKGALDWLLEHLKMAKELNDLLDFGAQVDAVAHVYNNVMGHFFYEQIKQSHRSAFGDLKPSNTITELLQAHRICQKTFSALLQRIHTQDYEFQRVFKITMTLNILGNVVRGLYYREIICLGDDGISIEPGNISEVIEIATYGELDIRRCDHVFSSLAYRCPQIISMTEASRIAKIFIDIIEDRDTYFFSTLAKILSKELSAAVSRANSSEETFRYHSKLASLFIFLGKQEAAFLALDVGKTKCLRATSKSSNSPAMAETWKTIKEGKEERRLADLSKEIKRHEENATVLVYHIDHYGVLHCCVLNGDVKLLAFTTCDKKTLIARTKMLLRPRNVQVRGDFSFFADTRENELTGDPFTESLTAPNTTSTRTVVRMRNPTQNTNASTPKTLLEKATLKLKELNAKWAAKNLFNLLICPVKEFIKGKKLIIVPDQFLFFLPFSRLLDDNDNYLSMKYNIQIVPTVHYLLDSFTAYSPPSESVGPAMFVGNPKLDLIYRNSKRLYKPLSPLPHATTEAVQLADLFNSTAIVEEEATKRRVIDHLELVSIFHVASHAELSYGWIYLAPDFTLVHPDTAEEEAYMLREGDLFVRHMKARLVFLSCCSTAMGEVCREGVFGIARAFLTAGARSVVVTLWPIDDFTTLEFTKKFYSFLCEEKFVCEALKLTMNYFQIDNDPALSSYIAWAPFQVFGEDTKFTKEEIENVRGFSTHG